MKRTLIPILTTFLTVPSSVWATSTGSLAGRVIPVTDRPAARRVWIESSTVTQAPVQATVGSDGTFAVPELPAGTVHLAVETSEGLYVVPTPVTIAPGTTRTLQLALGGRQDTSPATPEPEPKKKKKAGGVWANPLYATLIVVGSAVVVGLLVSELTQPNNRPASPSK